MALYFIFNWLGVSVSIFLATFLGADLVELGTLAEMNYAAVVFNLALAGSLFVSFLTYRCLAGVKLADGSVRAIRSPLRTMERRTFVVFLMITALIAVWALGATPPLLAGMPVSEYLRSLNSIERFAFISLAISALPLSQVVRDLYHRGKIGSKTAFLACLLPAVLWGLAGEKLGYLLFIFFLTALPWIDALRRNRRIKLGLVLAAAVTVILTITQYALTFDDPLAQFGARIAMQGQLWYYFYSSSPFLKPLGAGLDVIAGISGQLTLRTLMEVAMPVDLFLDYETASLTGSHLPALLYASGWALFPAWVAIFGVLFGISTTLLRLAVQSASPVTSYLLVACFVFPGVEVWVTGNTSRVLQAPMTFAIFFAMLLPLLAIRLRLKIKSLVSKSNVEPSISTGVSVSGNSR